MHRRAFILTAAAFAASPALAQVGPEKPDEFAALAGDALTPLEKQTALFKQQMKAMGYGGADVFYELKGAASPVRFSAASLPSFVVRAPADLDPQERFGLFKLTISRNTRRLATGKVNPLGYGTRNTKAQSAVEFAAVRHGGDFFKLDPTAPLEPGEYALAVAPKLGNNTWGWGGRGGGNQPVFAFGVD
jgi:hypothetical protein